MSRDVDVGGHKYRVGKLNARQQFHVMRKLAPVLGGIGALMKVDFDAPDGDALGTALETFADSISKLATIDADFVMDSLLSKVERQADNGAAWSFLYTTAPDGKLLSMFPDIDMAAELKLVWAAIVENFSPFFAGAFSALKGAAPKPSAPLNG